jgi:hypothetical protein
MSASDELVTVLKALPPFRPRLIDLARELATPSGEIDAEKAIHRGLEVRQATQEAEAAGNATKLLLRCLTDTLRS